MYIICWKFGRESIKTLYHTMNILKKYQVIYADPPWRYDFSKSNSREIENQYPTMDTEGIKLLVNEFPMLEENPFMFDDNAVLYLWATAPKIKEAFEVMRYWGFEYKTHAIWDKEILGMGYWFRGQHELLLVGVRGKFSPPEQSSRVGSVIKERRTKHSKKPNIVRELISKWYPTKNKIELFARQKVDGWDSWGNEVAN